MSEKGKPHYCHLSSSDNSAYREQTDMREEKKGKSERNTVAFHSPGAHIHCRNAMLSPPEPTTLLMMIVVVAVVYLPYPVSFQVANAAGNWNENTMMKCFLFFYSQLLHS